MRARLERFSKIAVMGAMTASCTAFLVTVSASEARACSSTPPPPQCGVSATCTLAVGDTFLASGPRSNGKIHSTMFLSVTGSDPRCPNQVGFANVNLGAECTDGTGQGARPGGTGTGNFTLVPGNNKVQIPFAFDSGPGPRVCAVSGNVNITLSSGQSVTTSCKAQNVCVPQASPTSPNDPIVEMETLGDPAKLGGPGAPVLHRYRLTNHSTSTFTGTFQVVNTNGTSPVTESEVPRPDPDPEVECTETPGTPLPSYSAVCPNSVGGLPDYDQACGNYSADPLDPPNDCSQESVNEVCGCDGTTYSNRCELDNAGVPQYHTGACKPSCANAPTEVFCGCDGETYDSQCAIDNAEIPTWHEGPCEDCSGATGGQVCGCDGVTYDNECLLDRQRVQKLHDGPCEPEPAPALGFLISTINGDAFPGKITDEGDDVCLPLPENPAAFDQSEDSRDVILSAGNSITLEVVTRSFGLCPNGSCGRSEARLFGALADGAPITVCGGGSTAVSVNVPYTGGCQTEVVTPPVETCSTLYGGDSQECDPGVCEPESDARFCQRLGANCGTTSGEDNCGNVRTNVVCGHCAGPYSECDNRTNMCVCVPHSDEELCGIHGASCDTITVEACSGTPQAEERTIDCSNFQDAGACCQGECCNACCPETNDQMCARRQAECGTVAALNNCGESVSEDCGTCEHPYETCDEFNQCVCEGETNEELCQANGDPCGLLRTTDRCGIQRTVACKSFDAPECCDASESDAQLCAGAGVDCGQLTTTDSCGNQRTVDCGICSGSNQTCDGNQCICVAETDAQFCARYRGNCDTITREDRCDEQRTVDCSVFMPADACGPDGCQLACCPEPMDQLCASNNIECGTVTATDSCGAEHTADCGTCSDPKNSCVNGRCICEQKSSDQLCQDLNLGCGTHDIQDNCGINRSVYCGDCDDTVCEDDTPAHAICQQQGASCGTITYADACNNQRVVDCGTCDDGPICTPETDAQICAGQMISCGRVSTTDNCGNARQVDCGACTDTCETDQQMCQRLDVTCGTVTNLDDCGNIRTVDCGECDDDDQCEIDSQVCANNNVTCGTVSVTDSCGNSRTVDCGECTNGCPANTCCPESDQDLCDLQGNTCGTVLASDSCGFGRQLDCGECDDTDICVQDSDATLCARPEAHCGVNLFDDNCGIERVAHCGACGDDR